MAATKRKFYKNKFNQTWMESYLVGGVSGDPYKFFCIPCCKKLSCDHQGLKEKGIAKRSHTKLMLNLRKNNHQ